MKNTKIVTCECGKSAPYQQIKRDAINLHYDTIKREFKMTCIMIIIAIFAFVMTEVCLQVVVTSESTGFSWIELRIGLFVGVIICCIIFAGIQYTTWFSLAAMSDSKFVQKSPFIISLQQDEIDKLDISEEEKDVLRKAELIKSKTKSPDGHFTEQTTPEEVQHESK